MDLFKRKDYLKKDSIADVEFSKAYRGMTDEISRVANEQVTIWGKITNWIYLRKKL